ncbi:MULTISPECIES: hypothetical protein [unclassified Nocardioides]|uniref:hypothetical protein n=1 Tax=unclassified Nocardioides TaxID=2615069 RepID=UPI0006F82BB4|nr:MULTISPECIES: hypothetical protein [unclassified Nocardioides]KRA30968.1 hypothetical protein ASD81_15830 [Nocardioides sp. Root614]KRA87589.1 hypothetical protein ASD84_16105 [Nocardioides sp. Root682]
MVEPRDPDGEQILQLLALHKYFLNADFLRDVFVRRIKRGQSPADTDPVTAMDDMIAMSLWYATVYVVIEGWRTANLADAELDVLLTDGHVDKLRRFRNQVFHYQSEYDNPKLLEFLGSDDADAHAATDWIKRTHAALGRAIQQAVEDLLPRR